jgi:hypothetical protein
MAGGHLLFATELQNNLGYQSLDGRDCAAERPHFARDSALACSWDEWRLLFTTTLRIRYKQRDDDPESRHRED